MLDFFNRRRIEAYGYSPDNTSLNDPCVIAYLLERSLFRRKSMQYHWKNPGYRTYEDYLERHPDGYTCHFVRPGWKLPRAARSKSA